MSTTPHLLISSFHNVSDKLPLISSYYMSIPSQPCFPHLLCNVNQPRFFLISSSYMSLKYSFLIVHLNFSDPLYFNVTKQVFVDSVLECAHLCQAKETCEAFKHRNVHDDVNCQITEGEPEVSTMLENDGKEKWTLYTLETIESVRNHQISCHQYSKDLRIALHFFILSTYVRSMHPIVLYQTFLGVPR
jgi:hypothetical protein